jgi:glycolate oxidase
MKAATLVDQLRDILGEAHLRTDPDSIRRLSTDATKRFHPADVIVFPGGTEDVSRIIRLADRENVPIVSRGGGVGYAGGAVPVAGGIVLAMERMNRILEVDPVDLVAVVEPGVVTEDLHRVVESRGLFYPPDPASLDRSTIGGNVAHNAGGPRAFKYGVTRQFLRGLEVVLPNGEVVQTGGRVVKNAVGYDLTDLMCGSEGTLGVITKAVLRLVPRPRAAGTQMALFDSVRSCSEAALRLIAEGIVPSKLEFVDGRSVGALVDYIACEDVATRVDLSALPRAKAILLVEVDGDEASVLSDYERCGELLSRDAVAVTRSDAGEDLWALRRLLSPAVARIRPHKINEDIVVPRRRIADYLEAVERLETELGLPIVCFGHIGDGNIHVNIMLDASDGEEARRGESAKARVFEMAVELGGTISGEHGIGIMKSEFLHLALGPATIEVMKAIKRAIDPKGIMNPGKIFP